MNTKNLIAILFVVILISSCGAIKQSQAPILYPSSHVNTATVADLEISDELISFTYEPSDDVRRGGDRNVITTAVKEALKTNGGGDILVGMQYTVKADYFYSSFISSIRVITVTGYPARYKNFRNLPDSIWAKTPLYTPNTYIENSTTTRNSISFY